jgi:predicted RNase H-like nuclease
MVEEVINAIDLDAIVGRVDLDAAVAGVDLDAAVAGVDIDAIAARLDLDAVIARVDLVAMVEEVIDAIDLPAIIRDSSGSMASETIRGARMTGISADEAISRSLENHLFRLRRKRVPPEAPP